MPSAMSTMSTYVNPRQPLKRHMAPPPQRFKVDPSMHRWRELVQQSQDRPGVLLPLSFKSSMMAGLRGIHSRPANANNEKLEAGPDRSRRTSGLEPGGVERRWTLGLAFGPAGRLPDKPLILAYDRTGRIVCRLYLAGGGSAP